MPTAAELGWSVLHPPDGALALGSAAASDAARQHLGLRSERAVVEVFVRPNNDGPSGVERAQIVSDCSAHFDRLSRGDVDASRSDLHRSKARV